MQWSKLNSKQLHSVQTLYKCMETFCDQTKQSVCANLLFLYNLWSKQIAITTEILMKLVGLEQTFSHSLLVRRVGNPS